MIKIKKGNIFTTHCQTIVNTVNCVGVMGAGIAYEFKLRLPEMFDKYKIFCDSKLLDIGNLWLYKIEGVTPSNFTYVLNFPTKKHWKAPSKIEYLEIGLQKFVNTYHDKGITSIAFPLLGAANGGLTEQQALAVMQKYLVTCDIDIEIWYFDPTAQDDLFEQFKLTFMSSDDITIKQNSSLGLAAIHKIKAALTEPTINSLSGLLQAKGIGQGTLEKAFDFVNQAPPAQSALF